MQSATKNLALRKMIVTAVAADVNRRKLSDAVREAIGECFAHLKNPEARLVWLMSNVAEPLADAYSKRTGEAVIAYRTKTGAVSFKTEEGRTAASQAAVMMLRYWVAQETEGRSKADPVQSLVKRFEKLTPAQRRAFLAAVK